MRPIRFEGYQKELGAPKDWNEKENGECLGLPVFVIDGIVMSCWKPTIKERVKLIFGKPITLSVFSGKTQPPVALEVRYPTDSAD